MKQDKIIEHVSEQNNMGIAIDKTLDQLGIPRSTYYSWKKGMSELGPGTAPMSPKAHELMPAEEKIILDFHDRNPHLRHRQIQGMIQNNGHYISPSSVYKVLKEHGRIDPFERRPSPLKEARYNILHKNTLWALDWSNILINWKKHHLLVILDVFSRRLMDFAIVPQVKSSDVQMIVARAIKHYKLETAPEIRMDQGSPNKSRATLEFFEILGAEVSFAQVRRPTENAYIERLFGTIKQEEIYIAKNYASPIDATEAIHEYSDYYNDIRPHQALWNFTPNYVYEIGSKQKIIDELKILKEKSKQMRREYHQMKLDENLLDEFIKQKAHKDSKFLSN